MLKTESAPTLSWFWSKTIFKIIDWNGDAMFSFHVNLAVLENLLTISASTLPTARKHFLEVLFVKSSI
jgi:hypothetical protein